MTQNLPAKQQKALEIRDYLQEPHIKGPLEKALPKWLNIDRMLRIVFTSVMKNPKLMDCSRESILQAVMQCAQLGLEPILGRAYLVPYWNSKKRCFEAQMQPGYQGLVDLARRTGGVADVWGEVVFENDEFDLSFGMERTLHHRPWYMDPAKRKDGEDGGGEPIGAYVIWQFKDGTKHPHFMPMHEISKRRQLSQAFRWAETGDPNKGGGKQDSIWHLWPTEQQLKTVIKHSSKLVPMSVEFLQAVEMDNELESGVSVMSFDGGAESSGGGIDAALEDTGNGSAKGLKPPEQDAQADPEPGTGEDPTDGGKYKLWPLFKNLRTNFASEIWKAVKSGKIPGEATAADLVELEAKWDRTASTQGKPWPLKDQAITDEEYEYAHGTPSPDPPSMTTSPSTEDNNPGPKMVLCPPDGLYGGGEVGLEWCQKNCGMIDKCGPAQEAALDDGGPPY